MIYSLAIKFSIIQCTLYDIYLENGYSKKITFLRWKHLLCIMSNIISASNPAQRHIIVSLSLPSFVDYGSCIFLW